MSIGPSSNSQWVVRPKAEFSPPTNIVQFVKGLSVKDLTYQPEDLTSWSTYVNDSGQVCLCRSIKWTVSLEGGEQKEVLFLFYSEIPKDEEGALEKAHLKCQLQCAVTKEMIIGYSMETREVTHKKAMDILARGGGVDLGVDGEAVFALKGERLNLELNPDITQVINGQRDRWIGESAQMTVLPKSLAPLSHSLSLQEFASLFHPDFAFTKISYVPDEKWILYTDKDGKECLGQSVSWIFQTAAGEEKRELFIETGVSVDFSSPRQILEAKQNAGLVCRVKCVALKRIMEGSHGINPLEARVQKEAFSFIHHLERGGVLNFEAKQVISHIKAISPQGSATLYLASLQAETGAFYSLACQIEAERIRWTNLAERQPVLRKGQEIETPRGIGSLYASSEPVELKERASPPVNQFKIDVENLVSEAHSSINVLIPPTEYSFNIGFHRRNREMMGLFQQLEDEGVPADEKSRALKQIKEHCEELTSKYEQLRVTQARIRDLFEHVVSYPSLRRHESTKTLASYIYRNQELLDEWFLRYNEAVQLVNVADVGQAVAIHKERADMEKLLATPATTPRQEKMLRSFHQINVRDTKKLENWKKEYGKDLRALYNPSFQERKKITPGWDPKDNLAHKKIEEKITEQRYFQRIFERHYIELVHGKSDAQEVSPFSLKELLPTGFTTIEPIQDFINKDVDVQRVELQKIAYEGVVTQEHQEMLEALSKIDVEDSRGLSKWEQKYSQAVVGLYSVKLERAKQVVGDLNRDDILHQALESSMGKQQRLITELEDTYQKVYQSDNKERVDLLVLSHSTATTSRQKKMSLQLQNIAKLPTPPIKWHSAIRVQFMLWLWLKMHKKDMEALHSDTRFKDMKETLGDKWSDENDLHRAIQQKIEEQNKIFEDISSAHQSLAQFFQSLFLEDQRKLSNFPVLLASLEELLT